MSYAGSKTHTHHENFTVREVENCEGISFPLEARCRCATRKVTGYVKSSLDSQVNVLQAKRTCYR